MVASAMSRKSGHPYGPSGELGEHHPRWLPSLWDSAPGSPEAPRSRVPRKTIKWRDLLDVGEASGQADMARRQGITRLRVTQVMGMLRLAPEIQQHVLPCPTRSAGRRSASGRSGPSPRWKTVESSAGPSLPCWSPMVSPALAESRTYASRIRCRAVRSIEAASMPPSGPSRDVINRSMKPFSSYHFCFRSHASR